MTTNIYTPHWHTYSQENNNKFDHVCSLVKKHILITLTGPEYRIQKCKYVHTVIPAIFMINALNPVPKLRKDQTIFDRIFVLVRLQKEAKQITQNHTKMLSCQTDFRSSGCQFISWVWVMCGMQKQQRFSYLWPQLLLLRPPP